MRKALTRHDPGSSAGMRLLRVALSSHHTVHSGAGTHGRAFQKNCRRNGRRYATNGRRGLHGVFAQAWADRCGDVGCTLALPASSARHLAALADLDLARDVKNIQWIKGLVQVPQMAQNLLSASAGERWVARHTPPYLTLSLMSISRLHGNDSAIGLVLVSRGGHNALHVLPSICRRFRGTNYTRRTCNDSHVHPPGRARAVAVDNHRHDHQ